MKIPRRIVKLRVTNRCNNIQKLFFAYQEGTKTEYNLNSFQ